MPKDVFVPATFFLLRIPTWPMDKMGSPLIDHPVEYFLKIYSENEQLREAIAIASPSLCESLNKRSSKNLIQEAKSLSHYISRMMVRPTPFGLFSSVSLAEWGESTTICYNEQSLRKRTRLDMEWVYLLIQKLYQEEKNFTFLPVRKNPFLHLSGERYHLDYQKHPNETDKELSQSISIRATPLIQYILDNAKEGIVIDQLWLKLKESLPILEKERTLAVLRELISKQFLLPGFIPSLLNTVPFDALLPYLSPLPGYEEILKEIKNYNDLSFGKGEMALKNLQSSMAALISNKSYLQVDTAYDGKNLKLSKNVSEQLEKALNLLWKITCIKKTSNNLTTYHSKFLEKYGEYRTVPLLELLDAEKGLGPSFENLTPLTSDQEWDKWLNQQWQNCLLHKKKEWVLTEKNVDSFLNEIDPADAPLSFDLFCKIFAESSQDIDLGNFLLVLTYISKEGGSVFGRFLDLLGDNAQTKLAHYFDLEEKLEPQSLFVELSYLPSVVRWANLTIRPCLRKWRLDLQEKGNKQNALGLEDIYVGATSSKFYLTDKESRCNIITRANHLFNVVHDLSPIKFMRYVTQSQYASISTFSWGTLQESAVFLPRVRFDKTILFPATWNMDPKLFLKESLSFDDWADKWDLPQSFFMVQGDQQLLFNRANPKHVDEILRKLKKGESLKFVESIEGAWIKGTSGNHYGEISIPFVRNSTYVSKEKHFKAAPYSLQANESRDKFPGCDWLYLKFYMNEEKISEFLVGHLYNFMESQENVINEWFIIRYRDPESHVRLRIRAQSFEIISKVLSSFEEQFRLWTHLGWIKDISIAKYERESERYGGPDLIEAAETLFFYDTLSALYVCHAFLTKQIQCEEVVLHALSIVNFLRSFDLKLNQMLELLDKLKLDESELKGFREHKNQLITLINALDGTNEIPEIQVMNAALEIWDEGIKKYCQQATHLEKERFDSIILSLLHMHCNRIGCLAKKEVKAKLYARHALLSIFSKGLSRLDFPISQTVLK